MQKKIYKIILHTLVFIVFSYFMPGMIISNGPIGHVLIGIGYSILYTSIPNIIHYFRIPKVLFSKIIVGMVLICGYLFILSTQFPSLFKMTKGYIGSSDFIIFTLPRFFTLDSQVSIILASTIILFICSIIIERLRK